MLVAGVRQRGEHNEHSNYQSRSEWSDDAFHVTCQRCLTKKAEPRRTKNRGPRSGTASANRRWLRRLVRPQNRHNLSDADESLLCGRYGRAINNKTPSTATTKPGITKRAPPAATP